MPPEQQGGHLAPLFVTYIGAGFFEDQITGLCPVLQMPVLIAIFAIVGLIWAALYVRHGSLLACAFAFLLCVCCLGYFFISFDVGPFPLTLDRLMWAGMAGLYLVRGWQGRTSPKPLGWSEGFLLAWVGLVAISMCVSGDPFTAPMVGDTPPVWRFLGAYLMPLGAYWVTRQITIQEKDIRGARYFWLLFGCYLAVTAVLEIAQMWGLVFPGYIADAKVGLHFGRARGPMVQSVSLGLYLSAVLVILASWWLSRKDAARHLLFLPVPLLLMATYLTYTRSAWGGAILGLGTAWFVTARKAWRVYGSVVAVCTLALIMVAKGDSIKSFQREGSAKDTAKSADMRVAFAYVSWLMFLDKPIWGCGFGHFPSDKDSYLYDRSTDINLESIRGYVHHNTFLSQLTELGLVGFVLYLGVIVSWAVRGWQLWHNTFAPPWARSQGLVLLSMMPVYAFTALGHELSYNACDHTLMFLLAGITSGLAATEWKTSTAAAAAQVTTERRGAFPFSWQWNWNANGQ